MKRQKEWKWKRGQKMKNKKRSPLTHTHTHIRTIWIFFISSFIRYSKIFFRFRFFITYLNIYIYICIHTHIQYNTIHSEYPVPLKPHTHDHRVQQFHIHTISQNWFSIFETAIIFTKIEMKQKQQQLKLHTHAQNVFHLVSTLLILRYPLIYYTSACKKLQKTIFFSRKKNNKSYSLL